MFILIILIVFIVSYLIGTIPTAYLFGKVVKGIDIREHGSGNVGATNVLRVLGKTWGIICLIFDILKGALGPFLAELILQDTQTARSWILLGSVAFVFLGHLFPIWLKFKGGKGAAVTAGSFIYLTTPEMSIALLFFVVIVAATRYVSLGSMLASILFTTLVALKIGARSWTENYPYLIISSILCIAIIFMHRKNIQRLLNGTESKIFSSSKKEPETS